MKIYLSNTIFTCGPFADSAAAVEQFANKLYFSYLFSDSMKKHEDLQREYEEAVESQDEELAAACLSELKLMEGVY